MVAAEEDVEERQKKRRRVVMVMNVEGEMEAIFGLLKVFVGKI